MKDCKAQEARQAGREIPVCRATASEEGLMEMRRRTAKQRRQELEKALEGLTAFGKSWCQSSLMPGSPFDKADEDAILRLRAKAVAYLEGWDALGRLLDGSF